MDLVALGFIEIYIAEEIVGHRMNLSQPNLDDIDYFFQDPDHEAKQKKENIIWKFSELTTAKVIGGPRQNFMSPWKVIYIHLIICLNYLS